MTEAEVRQDASDIGRSEDHGNCAASALLLALLRPQMFGMTHMMPPLRIFGVPPPRKLLEWVFSPRSGTGPDNFRGNVIEGLTMHLAAAPGGSAAADVLQFLQETWIMFRIRVDMVAALLGLQAPIEAWKIVNAALSVPDDILTD